jgi:hypothetical protein
VEPISRVTSGLASARSEASVHLVTNGKLYSWPLKVLNGYIAAMNSDLTSFMIAKRKTKVSLGILNLKPWVLKEIVC